MNKDYLKQLGDSIALAHWAKSNEKTYEEICDRVVNYICDDPSEEGRHYNHRMKDLLKSKKFIPNSPCWINAGTDMKNLFACYVIDLQDNMGSIMDTAKRMAMIMKEGGGVGVSLTPIRAEGSRVGGEGSERTASGPISFLKVFDAVVGAVKSAGVRRGAALANLKVGHPDLIKFIKCKEDQNQINNFNISVAITDEFMDDVINKSDKIWADEDVITDKKDEDGNPIIETIHYTASDVYDLIVEHMWRNGEPGVQFIDAFNNVDGKYTGRPEFIEFNTGLEVTNPCGETALKPNEACNLGSINLYHFVHPFWEEIDEDTDIDQINKALRQELKQTVEDAVDFLNLMLDKSETPFPEINEAVKKSRKVGLGVMGLADYLSAKGLVYGSPEAIHEAADIFAFITKTAEEHSLRKGYKNATLTVQAPTGTTGLVGEVSTGIEPHFMRCWNRKTNKMGNMLMYPKSLRDYIVYSYEHRDPNDTDYLEISALYSAIDKGDFNMLDERLQIKDGSRAMRIRLMWPTAHEITPKQHLAMLAAIQRHVHNSVSKTINLPHDATVEDVRELIMMAWRTGVKGFTCYRDGSRDSQPLKSIDSDSKDKVKTNDDLINHIRLDMTEEKRMEYLEKMSDEEPIFADTILKALAFDKILQGIDKTLLPAENIILSDTSDSKIFADKIRSKMVDDLQKELKDEDEEKTTLTKYEYEVLSKFAELGYEYVVNSYSDKLVTDILKEHPEIRINKEISQEQKASCKRPRPAITYGESIRTKIGCGTMYITVNKDDQGICEVFTSLGRKGGCPSQSEATSRLISLALRSGVKIDDIIDQLKGIRCLNTMRQGGIKQEDGSVVLSCPDAIGKALERVKKEEDAGTESFMKHFTDDPDSYVSNEDLFKAISSEEGKKGLKAGITLLKNKGMPCPKCGEQMDRDGGCVICRHCGYSKCG